MKTTLNQKTSLFMLIVILAVGANSEAQDVKEGSRKLAKPDDSREVNGLGSFPQKGQNILQYTYSNRSATDSASQRPRSSPATLVYRHDQVEEIFGQLGEPAPPSVQELITLHEAYQGTSMGSNIHKHQHRAIEPFLQIEMSQLQTSSSQIRDAIKNELSTTANERMGDRDSPYLSRAKIYLAASDYRRAIDACQAQINAAPSAEHYVYLTYVYHALRGYLDYLAEHDEWLKVGHVYLNLAAQDPIDLVDPPSILPRMATEMIHEGIRQQADVSAAMATRLDKSVTDRLWQQQAAWRQSHPERWWAGVPEEWDW